MAKTLKSYDGRTFYGKQIAEDRVPGLHAEIRHGTRQGNPYSYIVFLNEHKQVKWKIVPRLIYKKPEQVHCLKLFHRNARGRQGAFHSQRLTEIRTPGGVTALIEYIRQHEEYEHSHKCQEVNDEHR